MTNGPSHPYHLDESAFTFRGIRRDFFIFISFFDDFPVRKQNSPDGTPRFAVSHLGHSGAILFAYVPLMLSSFVFINI